MKDHEWRECQEPHKMLTALEKKQLNSRKAGWFAVAACRMAWGLLTDVRSRRAVEVAELWLEDEARQSELTVLVGDAREAHASVITHHGDNRRIHASKVACEVLDYVRRGLCFSAARTAANLKFSQPPVGCAPILADLLRDIYGDLSTRPSICGKACLTLPCSQCARIMQWGDFAARGLAETIYAERRFEDLPILADALEDAGCENAVLLEHLRGAPCPYCKDALFDVGDSGAPFGFAQLGARAARECPCKGTRKAPLLPHVKGCWALDLVLESP